MVGVPSVAGCFEVAKMSWSAFESTGRIVALTGKRLAIDVAIQLAIRCALIIANALAVVKGWVIVGYLKSGVDATLD